MASVSPASIGRWDAVFRRADSQPAGSVTSGGTVHEPTLGGKLVGGLGSGAWEKHNRQIVGSCCEIDANHLSARGCLEPGQSSTIPLGICNSPDDGIDRGGGGEVVVLNLRAEVGWLFLSWRSLLDNPDAGAVHACTGRERRRIF